MTRAMLNSLSFFTNAKQSEKIQKGNMAGLDSFIFIEKNRSLLFPQMTKESAVTFFAVMKKY